MKKILYFLSLFLMFSIIGCNQTNSSKQTSDSFCYEDITEQSIIEDTTVEDTTKVPNEVKKTEDVPNSEPKVPSWDGASSRSDFKQKLNGTVWESVSPSSDFYGRYLRLEINGNQTKLFLAKPTKNYDDKKNWGGSDNTRYEIEDIFEPREGVYVAMFRGTDKESIEGSTVPLCLTSVGNRVYLGLADLGVEVKRVK